MMLKLFQVDIASFAVAGAFVIFLMSLEMILDIEISKYRTYKGSYTSTFGLSFACWSRRFYYLVVTSCRICDYQHRVGPLAKYGMGVYRTEDDRPY